MVMPFSGSANCYFGGLTDQEVGETLDISIATVKRDWVFARTWLLKEME